MHPTWNLDPTRFLTRRELAAVLADVQANAEYSLNSRRNLIVVRLACCCCLRVSEIADLQLDDVFVDVERPHLRLRHEATKGHKPRCVPLWWDGGTLNDLREWKVAKMAHGASKRDRFVCSVRVNRFGQSLQRHAVRRRFLSACKVLAKARLRTLTIRHGRRTLISHALAAGRTLAEVRAAAGHSNVAITSVYLHVVVDESELIGELFGAR